VACWLQASAKGYACLLAAMLLASGGGGLIEMSVSSLISDRMPHRRTAALNLTQLVFGLSAASPLLLIWLLRATGTWRFGFMGLGLVGLALALARVLAAPQPKIAPNERRSDAVGFLTVIRYPRLWAIALGQAAYVFAEAGLLTWAVTYLVMIRGNTPAQAHSALSIFWVTLVAGRLLCGVYSSCLRPDRLLAMLSVTAALGIGLVLLAPIGRFSWILLGLLGIPYSGIFGTILAYAGDAYEHSSGTVFGVVMASGALGAIVGPWSLGVLAEATRLDVALGLIAVALLGTGLIFHRLGPSTRL